MVKFGTLTKIYKINNVILSEPVVYYFPFCVSYRIQIVTAFWSKFEKTEQHLDSSVHNYIILPGPLKLANALRAQKNQFILYISTHSVLAKQILFSKSVCGQWKA